MPSPYFFSRLYFAAAASRVRCFIAPSTSFSHLRSAPPTPPRRCTERTAFHSATFCAQANDWRRLCTHSSSRRQNLTRRRFLVRTIASSSTSRNGWLPVAIFAHFCTTRQRWRARLMPCRRSARLLSTTPLTMHSSTHLCHARTTSTPNPLPFAVYIRAFYTFLSILNRRHLWPNEDERS